jgi:hypothetical protein
MSLESEAIQRTAAEFIHDWPRRRPVEIRTPPNLHPSDRLRRRVCFEGHPIPSALISPQKHTMQSGPYKTGNAQDEAVALFNHKVSAESGSFQADGTSRTLRIRQRILSCLETKRLAPLLARLLSTHRSPDSRRCSLGEDAAWT